MTRFHLTLVLALAALAAVAFASRARSQAGTAVRVVQTDEGYQLFRGDEPYFIKGAGGQGSLEVLAAAGGNSTRTWGSDNARAVLDEAHRLGLTVTVGIWVQHPRHGFDYSDREAVLKQREFVRSVVTDLKDHPALLMWGIGNEVEMASDPEIVFPEINELARLVKQIDPNHPTMAVVASFGNDKIKRFVEMCPDVDVLGVNAYVEVVDLPAQLDRQGYDGPYVVTEFGPRGHWQVAKTDWDAPLEPTSTEKAATARAGYEAAILGRPGQCLGSYVFLWGYKQEKTLTWYGMFLPGGETTEVLDTMQRLWTGAEPSQRAPSIDAIQSPIALSSVAPEAEFWAEVEARDPDGDALTYDWLIKEETRDQQIGGDREELLPTFPHLTLRHGERAKVRAPAVPGAYRLFVTVTDGTGRAATANMPFRVREPAEDQAG